MLNLNAQVEQGNPSHWQEVWKVLIFDKYCSDVTSLLLKKGDLRNQGITLHLYVQAFNLFNWNYTHFISQDYYILIDNPFLMFQLYILFVQTKITYVGFVRYDSILFK